MASSLIHGQGFIVNGDLEPSLVRYPLYPILLAGGFLLFGEGRGYIPIQFILDAGLLVILYKLGREFFDEKTARLGIFFAALYPFTALYILRCLPETLFTLLLTLTFLFLCRASHKGKVSHFLLAGLFLGLATLCKSVAFYFGWIVPLLAFLPRFRNWRLVGLHFLVPLVALVSLLPWGLRNYQATGKFILLGTAGSYSLYIGNNVANDGRDRDEIGEEHKAIFQAHMAKITNGISPTVPEAAVPLKAALRKEFMEHPAASLGLVFRKAIRFWVDVYGPENKRFQIMVAAVQIMILLLAIPGIWLALHRHQVWPLVFGIGFMNGIHALVISTFRYSIPIMPLMMLFAAFTVCSFLKNEHTSTPSH